MISIKITIDGTVHSSPNSWQDVSTKRFLRYFKEVGNKEPQQLKDFVEAHMVAISELDEELTQTEREEQAIKLFADRWEDMEWRKKSACYSFFALDVGYWCGVDAKLIQSSVHRDSIFNAYWALQSQMNPNNASIDKDYTGFEIKGIEYLVPKEHMQDSTVEEFADSAYFQEQAQRVKGGDWLAVLDVMTVLCRPKGEKYNDNEAFREARKELFKELSMSHVINVAFFLQRLNSSLSQTLAIYTVSEEVKAQKQSILMSGTDGRQ